MKTKQSDKYIYDFTGNIIEHMQIKDAIEIPQADKKHKEIEYLLYRDKCCRCRKKTLYEWVIVQHYQELSKKKDVIILDFSKFNFYTLEGDGIVFDHLNVRDMQEFKKQYKLISSITENDLYPEIRNFSSLHEICKKFKKYVKKHLR